MACSAAANFRDQVNFAVGIERDEVGVLENPAVDCHRHALVDLAPETAEAAIKIELRRATFLG